MLKAVFFDFDGVIHNTFDFHRKKVREYSGIALSAAEYRDMHNGNFFEHRLDKLENVDWSAYGKFVNADYAKFTMRDEIRELLTALRAKFLLFIVSSGESSAIRSFFENNNVGDLFIEILGGDRGKSKSEKFQYLLDAHRLSTEECLFVTDTLGDILEAQSRKIRTVAVDFGYHDRKTLRQGSPYAIVSDTSELLDTIDCF